MKVPFEYYSRLDLLQKFTIPTSYETPKITKVVIHFTEESDTSKLYEQFATLTLFFNQFPRVSSFVTKQGKKINRYSIVYLDQRSISDFLSSSFLTMKRRKFDISHKMYQVTVPHKSVPQLEDLFNYFELTVNDYQFTIKFAFEDFDAENADSLQNLFPFWINDRVA